MHRRRPLIKKTVILSIVFIAGITFTIAVGNNWRIPPAFQTNFPPKKFTVTQVAERLKHSEMQIANIRPGLEKSITWAGNPHTRTEYAIVYVHGFSASKEELQPVPDKVAASLDANIFFTRLTGHARTVNAMRDASTTAWMHDLAEAFEVGATIGEKVIMISCSTGGTLVALGVATGMFSEKLFSAVFFSPNFGVQDKMAPLLTWPLARYWAPLIGGEMQTNAPRNALHARYWTTTYPTVSLIPMMELIELIDTSDMARSTVPVLFYFSPDDNVVDPQKTEDFIQRWRGPKQIVRIDGKDIEDNMNHIITGNAVSPSRVMHAVDTVITWHRRTTDQ